MSTGGVQYDLSGSSGQHQQQQTGGGTSSWIPTTNAVFQPAGTAAAPMEGSGPGGLNEQNLTHPEGRYKGLHPVAAFFHVCFKIAAVVLFLFGSLFANSVIVFIITILLLAFDFWTTKNITGRLLVSLRWWSEVSEDGTSHWVFEASPEADDRVNAYDRWFFWIVLGVNALVWVLLSLFNVMSISRLPITITGVVLACVNVLGYAKCRRERTRIGDFVLQQAAQRPEFVQQAAATIFKG